MAVGVVCVHGLGGTPHSVLPITAAVHAAGYPNFLGIAGRHRFFHTPADDVTSTGPDILEPVARAFTGALRKIAERGQGAFK